MQNIINAVHAARKAPVVQELIYKGFRFRISFRPDYYSTFEIEMSFVPGWGHTHYIYAASPDEAVQSIRDEVALVTAGGRWPNGGGYGPREYSLY